MGSEAQADQDRSWLELDRFRSRPDGTSEFVRARLPAGETRALVDHGGDKTAFMSTAFASPNVRMVLLPEGLNQPPHPAPEPQIVVVLKGKVEVATSDGTTKRWGPGDAFIASDHDGIGHETRVLEGPACVLFIPFDQSVDLNAWTV